MADQLPLFGFKEMLPSGKVPISAERIEEAKKLFEKGDIKGSVGALREVRYALENYCKRIKNK